MRQQAGFHESEDRWNCRQHGHRACCIRRRGACAKFFGGARASTRLRGAVERKDVPGVVALITDRERVLYQGAFGVADVATGRPLASDALFRIASMTKPVTSVALMQLIEHGRLTLDDPAEKYLPELAGLKVIESFDATTGAYQLRAPARK